MRWITDAPVTSVSDEEFERLAKEFIRNLQKEWMLKKPKDDDAVIWNKRVESSSGEADVYRAKYDNFPTSNFAYMLSGKAGALMRVTVRDDIVKIEDLSTHPGSSGAGEIMIEKAVCFSEKKGFKGCVSLYAAGNSKGFYKKLGFVETASEGTMKLDPRQSELWVVMSGNKWRLSRYPAHLLFAEEI